MELKPGYKQTEVGVIPEDWEITKLCSIANLATGNTPPTRDRANYGDEYFFVSPVDFDSSKWVLDTEKMLSKKGFASARRFPKGSILFTCIGSTIGKIGMAPCELTSNQQINAIFPNERFSSEFLYYCLDLISPRIKAMAGEQAVPIINKKEFGETLLPLPVNLVEQTAIASALSDADALIQSLTSLIAKKRQIKQGAMQTLLNPYENERLKEGWIVKTIEDICVPGGLVRGPFGGALKKEYFVASGYKVYEQRNAIYRNIEIGSYFIDSKKYQDLKRFTVKPGDFVISCSGTIGKIYQIPMGAPCGVINQALLKLTIDNERFSEAYFYHYFSWNRFQEKIIESTQGGAMKNLVGMPIFKVTEISTPEKLNEQTRIATILSDMDAEIAALETKLTKYQQIKQGMMQNLLTGRIRLVKPGSKTGAIA